MTTCKKDIPLVCDNCGTPFLGNRQQALRKKLGRKVGCGVRCTRVLRDGQFHKELQYHKNLKLGKYYS